MAIENVDAAHATVHEAAAARGRRRGNAAHAPALFGLMTMLGMAGAATAAPEDDPRALQPLIDALFDRSGPVLRGHADRIASADFSPDGLRVVTGSIDGSARLWDVHSGALIALLVTDLPPRTRPGVVFTTRFSTTGRYIARDWRSFTPPDNLKVVDLWDGHTGLPVRRVSGLTTNVRALAFSRDDTRLIVVREDGVRIWDLESGVQLAGPPRPRRPVQHATLSPFGERVWMDWGEEDTELRRTDDGAVLVKGGCGDVRRVVFSADGSVVLCNAGSLAPRRILDARTGALKATLDADFRCLLEGTDLIAMAKGTHDLRTGTRLVPGTPLPGPDLAFACPTRGGFDFIDGQTGANMGSIRTSQVTTAYAPANRIALTLGEGAGASCCGRGTDALATLWATRLQPPWHWAEAPSAAFQHERARVGEITFAPDGQTIAAQIRGRRDVVAAWHVPTGRLRMEVADPERRLRRLRFSPDGVRLLAEAGVEFDLREQRVLPREPDYWRDYGYLPHGHRLVSLGNRSIWWDDAGVVLRQANMQLARDDDKVNVIFATQAPVALVDGWDIRVLDSETGATLVVLAERSAKEGWQAEAFSASGGRAVLFSTDGSRGVWRTSGPGARAPAGEGGMARLY
ncbi:MAG: hypothetical protein KC620_13700, partial [Myxococcales bacterium]|nr:hypothetical protein [Myxococcales bacterium]